MSDLVGNPEDRFSHNEAQIILSRGSLVGITGIVQITGRPIADTTRDLERTDGRIRGGGGGGAQLNSPRG